jgi:hypothetical protein
MYPTSELSEFGNALIVESTEVVEFFLETVVFAP